MHTINLLQGPQLTRQLRKNLWKMQTTQPSYQNMLTSNQKTRQPYDAPLKPLPLQPRKLTKPYELGKNKSQPSIIAMAKSLAMKRHNDSLNHVPGTTL